MCLDNKRNCGTKQENIIFLPDGDCEELYHLGDKLNASGGSEAKMRTA